MIIECPSCLTRYDTPAPQIPKEGRNVRCAKCAHVWLIKPEEDTPELEPVEQEDDASTQPEGDGETQIEAAAAETAETEVAAESADAGETGEAGGTAEAEAEDAGLEPDHPAEDAAMETGEVEETEEVTAEPVAALEEDISASVDAGEAMAASEAESADQDWLGSDDIDWGEDDEEAAPAFEAVEEPEPEPEPVTAPEPEPEPDLQSASEDQEMAETEETEPAEPAGEDEGDLETELPPHAIPEEGAAQGPDRRVLAGWAGLALFVVVTATLAVTQRVGIVRALPGAASFYRTVGLPVNVRGLDFDKVTSTWTVEAGRSILEIHGDIVNVTDDRVTVPTVVFALRNSKGLEVYQWAAEVRNEPLGGGERTPFVARIPTPPKSIQSVQVKFAKSP